MWLILKMKACLIQMKPFLLLHHLLRLQPPKLFLPEFQLLLLNKLLPPKLMSPALLSLSPLLPPKLNLLPKCMQLLLKISLLPGLSKNPKLMLMKHMLLKKAKKKSRL